MLLAKLPQVPSRSACMLGVVMLAMSANASVQQSAPPAQEQRAAQPAPAAPTQAAAATSTEEFSGGITEDELKQMLVGKTFYLRGRYLDNELSFNQNGGIVSRSADGSYTLSLIEIDRIRLAKHKLQIEGIRYGLHFLGALPYEDPSTAVDKVRITPKKKIVRISIDREIVIKPKKVKPDKSAKNSTASTPDAPSAATPTADAAEADSLKADLAATPEADRPADPNIITTTTSPAHAAMVLKKAIDRVFASTLDDRMMADMPDFWKLYYQAAAAKVDFVPSDPAVLRQNNVDQKARLLTSFEPESNEYAQTNGIAGMALYHTVIGADGKPQEIAVDRPIGFGLDENAVAAIRNAKFEPATKDGKPVPVLLDLVVQFRIFSKRTAATSATAANEASDKPADSQKLPGPYSVQQPQ